MKERKKKKNVTPGVCVCVCVYSLHQVCVCVCVCVYSLHQVSREGFLADRLLCQGEPELTGLQRHILIRVLGPREHVLHTGGEGGGGQGGETGGDKRGRAHV